MAIKTPCQTSGAVFITEISDGRVSVTVELGRKLLLDKEGAELLEANLHNAIELVLARYYL
jgi:hypothetical protein